MKLLYQYKCTKHFRNRIKERGIHPYLVSLCIAKGIKSSKERLTLSKEKIKQAIMQGYIEDFEHYIGIDRITIVIRKNRLITAYTRYSDIGLMLN